MISRSTRSAPKYPTLLQEQITHASRFARALRVLQEGAAPEDPAFFWLEGRSAEVGVFTVDVLRGWTSGELDTQAAASTIGDYLQTLHATLEGWYGRWYAPSCCGPLAASAARGGGRARTARPPMSLTDTMADAPPAFYGPRAHAGSQRGATRASLSECDGFTRRVSSARLALSAFSRRRRRHLRRQVARTATTPLRCRSETPVSQARHPRKLGPTASRPRTATRVSFASIPHRLAARSPCARLLLRARAIIRRRRAPASVRSSRFATATPRIRWT